MRVRWRGIVLVETENGWRVVVMLVVVVDIVRFGGFRGWCRGRNR